MEAEDGSAGFDFLFLCLPCVRVSSLLLFSSFPPFGFRSPFPVCLRCVSRWKIGKLEPPLRLHRMMLKMGLKSSR